MGDETRPLAGLPPADRTLLVEPPLELAVVEVRFDSDAPDVESRVAFALREALADVGQDYPRMERAQENRVEIQMNPDAAVEPQARVAQFARGWRLHAADDSSTVTILPSAVVLQTRRYERWSVTLRPAVLAMLEIVQHHLAPALVVRIGLRYVDRFVDDTATASTWSGRISPHLLGAVEHPVFGSHVQAAQQQIELGLGPAHGAILRHGPFSDPAVGGAISYLVDIDVFDVESTSFDPESLTVRAEVLNRTAATLFQATLTRDYLRELQNVGIATTVEGGSA
ncbi:TIGR04255 family protein [Amycolatopsis sp. NPDC051372]|uniref:TIGR04255 family protein n=1 Tax=Amycolatopsis sp. NPDC051372 TaxID=3155669 RepID=UPI003431D9E7